MNCTPIDMVPTQSPFLPTSWAGESVEVYFTSEHSFIHGFALRNVFTRTCVTYYTSANIYNFNSRLAHFNAPCMEHICSVRTGIMAEYPEMSTSQGTYVRIEQTSEAIRETCRAGGGREDWNWEPLLYTNDCTSKDPSVELLKFADNTTLISLIQDGDESAYLQTGG